MAKANSTAVRSGRRSADVTLPSSVRCRKGDLAIRLEGRGMGQIVEVVEYYGTVTIDSGEVLVNAWHVQHPSDDPDTDYFKEDKYLLPIRPGDLDKSETEELSLVHGRSA